MSRAAVVKAALALAGAVVFGAGIRLDDARVRWAGVALFVLALVARWWPGARAGSGVPPSAGV